ncbi:hypothetical protein Tco_1276197 [Tanacetum coccineum]
MVSGEESTITHRSLAVARLKKPIWFCGDLDLDSHQPLAANAEDMAHASSPGASRIEKQDAIDATIVGMVKVCGISAICWGESMYGNGTHFRPIVSSAGSCFTFNTGKDLLSSKKSGEDGDGGRVNVGLGVDNCNNKRIMLSGIKLTDDDVDVSSTRPLKKISSSESWDSGGESTDCFGSSELHVYLLFQLRMATNFMVQCGSLFYADEPDKTELMTQVYVKHSLKRRHEFHMFSPYEDTTRAHPGDAKIHEN